MAKRFKLKKGKSKRIFRNTAGAHPKNMKGAPMRGGIRL